MVEPLKVSLTITGAPRTKKNSGRISTRRGSPIIFPSAAWQKWLQSAVISSDQGVRPPIAYPVNCQAIFHRDRRIGDAVGYYQGLADLLEKRGVVMNDRWIVSWDGSRLEVDHDRPRVEVVLESDSNRAPYS